MRVRSRGDRSTVLRLAALAAAGAACGVLLGIWAAARWLPDVAWGHTAAALCLPVAAGLVAAAACSVVRSERAALRRARALVGRIEAERQSGKRLCLSTIEALAYAMEARTPYNLGHLARIVAYATALAREMGLDRDTVEGVRVAALLHDIGRLGVPDNILTKDGALTAEETEKMRAYPVLSGRLLATVPFAWPVVSIVRHHREHYDGTGYPDGLKGDRIALGARVLAVADAYDSLTSTRAHRPRRTHAEAMAVLEQSSGSEFDPTVVAAFRRVVDSVNAEIRDQEAGQPAAEASGGGVILRSAAYEIARAQREVQALYELACSVGSTLCLESTLQTLAQRIRAIVTSSACVIFLTEADGEYLRAYEATGANEMHFRGSVARVGAYATGRAAYRAEVMQLSYMADDVRLVTTPDPWVPLRSTLITPLRADGQVIGTINLYHAEPGAFERDDVRVMTIVGSLAGRAVANARLFAETQESALTDSMTGLRNLRYLRRFLDQETNRALKNGHTLAVLGLDLDNFKPVNDTYGHGRGDDVLRDVAALLRSQIRNYDLAVRCSGDEFVVVLPETTRAEAATVAAKIRDTVGRYVAALTASDRAFPSLGISIGIAVYPEDATDAADLVAYADQLMYADKRSRAQRRAA